MAGKAIPVTVGFKAFDVHELLLHFIAMRHGLYHSMGLNVRLQDVSFVADEQLPPSMLTVGCGAALLARARGVRRKVVLAAVDRPLFWIHA